MKAGAAVATFLTVAVIAGGAYWGWGLVGTDDVAHLAIRAS